MITSPDNQKLKEIRKLARSRKRTDLFIAEGEDLVDAAWEAEYVLRAGVDVEEKLLADASTLGSGTRVIGVYRERWSEPGGGLSVFLDGIKDPGNIGTIIRSAHALCDGPVIIGPRCADPYGPKAVRASMGSIFARPPARAKRGRAARHQARARPRRAADGPRARAPRSRRRDGRRGACRAGAGRAESGSREGAHPDSRRRPRLAERGDGGDRGAVRART